MGNQTNSESGIIIHFDKPYYLPGDMVSGTVNAILGYNHNFREISINLLGKEEVEWFHKSVVLNESEKTIYRNGHNVEVVNTQQTTQKTYYRGEKIIFSMYNSIGTVNAGAGQYSFPFKISLPGNLPGSFEYVNEYINASVVYAAECKATRFDGSNICLHRPFFVRQFMYLTNPSSLTSSGGVSNWCSSKGSASIKVACQKNTLMWGEATKFFVEVDNKNCSLNASGISISLEQKISVNDGFGCSEFLTNQLTYQTYDLNCAGGLESSKSLDFIVPDYSKLANNHYNTCRNVNLYQNPKLITILQNTVKGSLVTCEYFFRIHVAWDGCRCCDGVPDIEYPVLLTADESMRIDNAPIQWNTQPINIQSNNNMMMNVGVEPKVNVNMNMGMNMNVNTSNVSMNVNQNSGGMMMNQGYEPQVNMQVKVNNNGMMMNQGHEPQVNINVSSNMMMSEGNEPMLNSGGGMMMSVGYDATDNSGGMMMSSGRDPDRYN